MRPLFFHEVHMTPLTHYLWNTQNAGWVSKMGGTTTLLKDAQPFTYDEAGQRFKRGYEKATDSFRFIPIRINDTEAMA